MSLNLCKTEKEYYVLVNRKELLAHAKGLGYENCSLFEQEAFSNDEIKELKDSNLIAVLLFQFSDGNDDLVFKLIHQLKLNGITANYYELYDLSCKDNLIANSMETAIRMFPTPKRLEADLKDHGVLQFTDYKNRCGHCHELMDEGDRYCRYCGTERGKGEFMPYTNSFEVLYGPPIKVKHMCMKCLKTWVGSTFDKVSKYCPQCGENDGIRKIESDMDDLWFFCDIGKKEPYDIDVRPKLLDDEEIQKLLKHRRSVDTRTPLIEISGYCASSGVNDPGKNKELNELTELEAEQCNQIRRVELTSGTDYEIVFRLSGECPNCHSRMIAALKYAIYNPKTSDYDNRCIINTESDGLSYSSWTRLNNTDLPVKKPAFFCLGCADTFGELDID